MMCASNRRGTGSAPSLYDEADQEADRHKWIVSEQRGCDCGDAWHEWWHEHWPRFCRYRRIEHLRGDRRWAEFEDHTFGKFYDLVVQGDPLVNIILDNVAKGWENLDFIRRIDDDEWPCERLIEILTIVNINTAARLAPRGT